MLSSSLLKERTLFQGKLAVVAKHPGVVDTASDELVAFIPASFLPRRRRRD